MEQALVPSDLAALSAKLDALSAQVGYLSEQARRAERAQRERAELMHDVLPIANDAVGLVTEQLEEIQGYVDLSAIPAEPLRQLFPPGPLPRQTKASRRQTDPPARRRSWFV
jgi:hypothetical protein